MRLDSQYSRTPPIQLNDGIMLGNIPDKCPLYCASVKPNYSCNVLVVYSMVY